MFSLSFSGRFLFSIFQNDENAFSFPFSKMNFRKQKKNCEENSKRCFGRFECFQYKTRSRLKTRETTKLKTNPYLSLTISHIVSLSPVSFCLSFSRVCFASLTQFFNSHEWLRSLVRLLRLTGKLREEVKISVKISHIFTEGFLKIPVKIPCTESFKSQLYNRNSWSV